MTDAHDANKERTAFVVEELIELRKVYIGEASALARWLTASLLATNGAAALAVFNAAEKLQHPSLDAAPFVGGVLAALVAGSLSQRAASLNAMESGDLIWKGASIMKPEATPLAVQETERNAHEGQLVRRLARFIGLASIVSMTIGAVVTGLDEPPADAAAQRRCLAIQRDMLSAYPQKKDGAELFQAFGCRPQGEGSVMVPERTTDKAIDTRE